MRDRLSVLFVSASLNTGGAQRFTSTLLRHLDRNRFMPSLALLRDDIGFDLADDVDVCHLEYRGPRTFFKAAERLRQRIHVAKPDIVLSNIAATNLVTAVALRRCRPRPKWIARVGNSPLRHDGPVRSWLARRNYCDADLVVCNSLGLKDEVSRVYPIESNRLAVIGNPTDFAEIDQLSTESPSLVHEAKEPLLIAVGRLYKQKRYDVMLDAFANVLRQRPAQLWICGEGPCRKSLERQIRRLGLLDTVHLLGYCPNPYALLRQADLFLMSSDHEGLPNALIEAQGLGLAAVSTRCPHGPDEIINNGETGILTPPGNRRAFADAVMGLLANPTHREEIGQRARELARLRFDSGALCQQWQACMADVAKHQIGVPECVA